MHEHTCFLNGRFLPASELAISPTDAGFVLGATVAEQLRTFGGELFRLDEHLARLERSLAIIDVLPTTPLREFPEIARELVARNHGRLAGGNDLGLSIFVTPGPYTAYASARSPGPAEPTLGMHTYPLPFHLWARKYQEGQALVVSDVVQVPQESWPPGLKCRSRMHYYLADRQATAADPGARALLLDNQGFVAEASTANVMVFTEREGLLTPPPHKVLQGVSMGVVDMLAKKLGIASIRRDLTPDDVAAADEVLLTSTPVCLLPVTRFNKRPIGSGRPGPVFGRLLAAWNELVGIDIANQAEQFQATSNRDA